MAIVQISRITHRKGLQENLPQLAGAELGWSIDERRLFIGNGTLEEGAPVVGNTEILTEFSDILSFQTTYTYKGNAAGYTVQTGPTTNDPVSQSLQSWLDQFATVKDFGAVGDGITDDTEAINRALYQLYCRESNTQIRRSLFFPAGVYLVTQTIMIPPFATLYGEGVDASIIQLASGDDSALTAYVARTTDSLQQYGVNIGNNGAITPQYVTISNMAFETLDPDSSVFLVEDCSYTKFTNVGFTGPLTTAQLTTAADDISGVRFSSTASLPCLQNIFDGCVFSGTTFGINTDYDIQGSVITNSKFNILYQGVVLASNPPVRGGPTGVKIVNNIFDSVYVQGIYIDQASLNGTGHNIFYDVGNHFNGTTNPASSVIYFNSANNVSIGDMFERGDAYATTYPRVDLSDTAGIAFTNGSKMQLGSYTRETGLSATLVNNTSSADVAFTSTLSAFTVNYTIVRDTARRTGVLAISNYSGVGLTYTDDFVQTSSTGVVLSVTQSSGTVSIEYTSTNTGVDGEIFYSISSTL